jgi:hypothetical protein
MTPPDKAPKVTFHGIPRRGWTLLDGRRIVHCILKGEVRRDGYGLRVQPAKIALNDGSTFMTEVRL